MNPLIVRRTIRASAERVFDAWTTPAQLLKWWGPRSVECVSAEVDLRIGGAYRLANRLPDGRVIWITGTFESIDRPRLLVYSWTTDPSAAEERVTVQFIPIIGGTEVIVTHERIPTASVREQHHEGWIGCLAGLAGLLEHDA